VVVDVLVLLVVLREELAEEVLHARVKVVRLAVVVLSRWTSLERSAEGGGS
jgi:hypothetical protein